jgi:hypothetical protein
MRLKSLLLLGITSTLTFGGLFLNAGAAEAKAWKLPEGYQGPVCIRGRATGNVSIRLGGWSTQFNGMAIREEGAFHVKGPTPGPDTHPAMIVAQAGARIYSETDKFVARQQPYEVQITSGGDSTIIHVSDNTAMVRRRACGSPFKVHR